MNKKIFLISIMLIVLCSLSAASASEINGTDDIVSVDSDVSVSCDIVSASEINSSDVNVDSDSDVLSASSASTTTVSTWSDLKSACTDATQYDIIYVSGGITPPSTRGQISINKNIIIEGLDGSYIGGSSGSDVKTYNYIPFYITASGLTITFKNLNFQNMNGNILMQFGGNGNYKIENCNFTNVNATGFRQSVVYLNYGELNITDSKFTNCVGMYGPVTNYYSSNSATVNYARMNVNNCEFKNNRGTSEPGAINNCGLLNVRDSVFENNQAGLWAGAIHTHMYANTTIVNSTFKNNKAGYNGGALYTYSILNVYNSTFEGNNCTTNIGGGAIGASSYGSTYNVTINNCNFTNNRNLHSAGYGGAISAMDAGYFHLYYSTFINNSATTGKAIAVREGEYIDDNHTWDENVTLGNPVFGIAYNTFVDSEAHVNDANIAYVSNNASYIEAHNNVFYTPSEYANLGNNQQSTGIFADELLGLSLDDVEIIGDSQDTPQWSMDGYDSSNSMESPYSGISNGAIAWNYTGNTISSLSIDKDGRIILVNNGHLLYLYGNGTFYSEALISSDGSTFMFFSIKSYSISPNNYFTISTEYNNQYSLHFAETDKSITSSGPTNYLIFTKTVGLNRNNTPLFADKNDGKVHILLDDGDMTLYNFNELIRDPNTQPYDGYAPIPSYQLSPIVTKSEIWVPTTEGIKIFSLNAFVNEAEVSPIKTISDSLSLRPLADANGNVYFFTSDSISKADTTGVLKTQAVTDGIGSRMAVSTKNNALYSVNALGTLYKYSLDDLAETKLTDIGSTASTIMTDANGIIYVGSDDGKFYAFDDEGNQKWMVDTESTSAVKNCAMDNEGNIYFYTAENKVYAIQGVPEPMGFAKLNESISNNNVVDLTDDVTLLEGEDAIFKNGIQINHDVTINGNNHVVNGTDLVRIFNIANNANVVLKDLIITGARATSGHGGAIYMATGTLTVENCTFVNNTLFNGGAHGGAIHAAANTRLTISNSVFEHNINTPPSSANWWSATSNYGGAIYCGDYVTLAVTNTLFKDNIATSGSYSNRNMYDGAISAFGANSLNTITNCKFINNTATNGIGAIEMRVGNITGCIFDDNYGTNDYPAVYISSNGNAIISYNVFMDDTTQIRARNSIANIVEEYNWWATNEPGNLVRMENTYAEPNKFIMMDVTNVGKTVKAGFVKDSNRDDIPNVELLPVRDVIFEGDVDNLNAQTINGLATVNYNSQITEESQISATIDGYTLTYTLKEGNITGSSVIYVEDTVVGDDGSVIIQFFGDNGPVDGTATVLFNDTEYTVNIVNGLAMFDVGSELDAGVYDIYYEYLGGSKYTATLERIKDESKFTVEKADVEISFTNEHNVITFNVSQAVTPTGTINVTLGDVNKILTLSDGVVSYNFGLDIAENGTYDLNVIYSGDKNHNGATFEDTFDITKSSTVLVVGVPEEVTTNMGDNYVPRFNFNVTCDDVYVTTGTISFNVGESGLRSSGRYDGGSWYARFQTWSANPGEFEITLKYDGDGYYTPANTTFKMIISPTVASNVELSGDKVTVDIKISSDGEEDWRTFDDYSALSDADGTFTITYNDEILAEGTIENGVGSASFDRLEPNTYNLEINYGGNDNYPASTGIATLKIPRTSQWASVGGNPQNSGIADAVRNGNPIILWNATIGGSLRSSAVIDSFGNIYVNNGGKTYAFTENGTLIWSGGVGSAGIAIFNDEWIFAPQSGNAMMIYNAATGASAGGNYWSASSAFAPIVGPDGRIYTPSDYGYPRDGQGWSGEYYVSVMNEGTSEWDPFAVEEFYVQVSGVGYGSQGMKASPSFDKNGYLYANSAKGFKIVSLSTGSTVFSDDTFGATGRAVIDSNDIAYIFGKDNKIYAVTLEGHLWNTNVTGGYGSTLAVDNENGYLYAVSKNGVLYKYDINDNGAESEVYDLTSNATSIIIDANSTVYVATQNGNLTAIGADGGLLWTINLGSSISGQLAMNKDGTIYATADNTLFAIGSTTTIKINTTVDYDSAKVIITAILGDNVTGDVVFTVDTNVSSPVAVEGNVATFEIPFEAGNHTIQANFLGNSYYAPVDATAEINLTKLDVEFDGVPEEITMKDYVFFNFNLIQNNTTVAADTSNFKVYKNDEELSSYDIYDNGGFELDLWDISSGNYDMVIAFIGDAVHNPVNATFSLTVLPRVSANVVVTDDEMTVDVIVGDSVYPYNPISDATGKFTIISGNKTVAEGTIKNGVGNVTFDKLEPGIYEFIIVYDGDDNYPGNNATASVKIPRTSQWPSVGGNPQNSGIANATREDGVSIIWKAALNGDLRSSAIIDSFGNVYVNDGSKIYAFTSEGTLIWSGGIGSAGIALYKDELILDPQYHNAMMIYNATTGAAIPGNFWSASSAFAPITGPDGRIYTPTDYGYPADGQGWSGNYWVSVFDETDYEWEPYGFNLFLVEVTGVSYGSQAMKASPSFDSLGYIYANTVKGFKIVNIATGATVFSDAGINGVGRPVIDANNIAYILDSTLNGIYAISIEGILWNTTVTDGIGSTIAVDNENGFLYAVNTNGILYKYDVTDGSESLVYDLGSAGVSIILDADSNVYVSTAAGDVVAINAEGDVLWTINLGSKITGQLAMDNNGIIYAVADKVLYALGFDATMNITGENVTVFDDEIITVTINAEGNVTIIFNGESTEVPIEDGTATLNVGKLAAGTYTVSVTYPGDGITYGPSFAETTFEILKSDAEITGDIVASIKNSTLTLTLPADATGIVLAKVDGKGYYAEVENGNAVIEIPELAPGKYPVDVIYCGDDNYNNASLTTELEIPELLNPELTADVDDMIITVSINENATGKIIVTVGNNSYVKDASEAPIIIDVADLPAGTYDVAVEYMGDENFNNATASASVTVPEIPPVEPKDPNLKASVENTTVSVSVDKDATGYVVVDVDGTSYYAEVKNGNAVIEIPALRPGSYSADVTYAGDENYKNATASVSIVVPDEPVVEPKDPNLKASVENTTVSVSVDKDATGYVVVDVDGTSYYAEVKNGNAVIEIPALRPGSYSADVTYAGDENYKNATASVSIVVPDEPVVEPKDPNLKASVENTTVSVSVDKDATGYVVVDVDGTSYYAEVENGNAVIEIPALRPGSYNADVTYAGDENYKNASTTVSITVPDEPVVEPKDPNLKATAVNNTITATVDKDATGNILVDVDGQGYYAPIKDGKAVINVIGLDEGKYNAVVSYVGDDTFKAANTTVSITVPKKEDPQPEPVDPKADIKVNNETVSVDLPKDATGYLLVDVDGQGYYAPVKDGKATLDLPELAPGNHTVTVTYTGDKKYDSANATQTITVEEDIHTVVAENLTKVEKAPDRFEAVFTDAKGNPLANTDVTFELNGQKYTRTTDANGKAGMAINLIAGNYTIVTSNPVTGQSVTNTITVLPRLEGSDLTKYFRNASQYRVKVYDDNGNPVKAGEIVTFNINGVFYNRTTGNDGFVQLSINLNPGDYIITTQYKGCQIANNIKVLPILSAKDLTKKYGVPGAFETKLVDGQGKAYANQAITFNINGVLYTRNTNSDGIAKLNINLMPGQYIITSVYGNAAISNTVTVTA